MPSRFAEELRKLRYDQKLSQSAMAYKLHVDPSRISRWEHDEQPPLNMVERISTTFGVNAHEWLHESQQPPNTDASAIEPRVVHMKSEPLRNEDDHNWRSKAIDLLSRMTDLLESLIKNAGGGVSKPISGQVKVETQVKATSLAKVHRLFQHRRCSTLPCRTHGHLTFALSDRQFLGRSNNHK